MTDEFDDLGGVIPAVATPLTQTDELDVTSLELHMKTLADEGCHGVLLMGTTGEGPSLSFDEREVVIEVGVAASQGMTVLAGTGTPSLPETIRITRRAFELGVGAVLVLPPYYYKNLNDKGLVSFFRRLVEEAVPPKGKVLLYHIPQVSGVSVTFGLVEGLLAAGEARFVGIKDSGGDLEHTRALCSRYPELRVFTGSDRLLLPSLKSGAAGCITAGANVLAALQVRIYQAFLDGREEEEAHGRLAAARDVLEHHQPFAAAIKALLARRYRTSNWNVRPPLLPMSVKECDTLIAELLDLGLADELAWLGSA